MRTIFKYPLPVTDDANIPMPAGAEILCVQTQRTPNGGTVADLPFIWAAVESTAPPETRRFHVRGTGHPLGDIGIGRYVGTFQMMGGGLVFHVFEGRD